MRTVPLALAAAAAAAVALPGDWWLASLGVAIVAIAVGWSRFRDRGAEGWARLAGVAGATAAAMILVAGLAKVALTLAAVREMAAAL